MWAAERSRSYLAWGLAHGISRTMLHAAARRGDLVARTAVDPGLRENPFPAYDEIRRRGPLTHGRLIGATAHHAVANEMLRSDDFGVGAGHGELPMPMRRVLEWASDPYARGPVDPPSMLAVDPPDHTRYRRLVSRAFTARSVMGMEARVTAVAEALLDELSAERPSGFDLVERYAARLPVAVIADLLGVAADMHGQLLEWGNRAALMLDPGLSWREYHSAETAVRQMHQWFERHLAHLRVRPGDDLLSRLTLMEGDERLSDLELRAIGLLLLGAGFETTVNLIGNAVVLLCAHPDQAALLRESPDGYAGAVEEVLRFDSPVQLTVRQAYADTSVAGASVERGQAFLVMLGGANRDPAVFEDPGRFDVTRSNAAEHLALSAGVHYCLGASLARLEATVALRSLYARFPDLRVVGPPTRRTTRVLRGFEHLPVALA